MKKRISLILVAMLLLTVLSGCGGKEAPDAAADPNLGRWIGITMKTEGFEVPIGEEIGLGVTVVLNEGGKAVYELFDEEDGTVTVEAEWAAEGNTVTLTSEDEYLKGTFAMTIEGDTMTAERFPDDSVTTIFAREGTEPAGQNDVPESAPSGVIEVTLGEPFIDNEHATIIMESAEYDEFKRYTPILNYTNHDDFPHQISFRHVAVEGVRSYCSNWLSVPAGETAQLEMAVVDPFSELPFGTAPEVTNLFAEFAIVNEEAPFGEILIPDMFVYYPQGKEACTYFYRDPGPNDVALMDNDIMTVTCYSTDENSVYGMIGNVFAENWTSGEYLLQVQDAAINGTPIDAYVYIEMGPGMAAYGQLTVDLDDMEAAGIAPADVAEVTGTLVVTDWAQEEVFVQESFVLNP